MSIITQWSSKRRTYKITKNARRTAVKMRSRIEEIGWIQTRAGHPVFLPVLTPANETGGTQIGWFIRQFGSCSTAPFRFTNRRYSCSLLQRADRRRDDPPLMTYATIPICNNKPSASTVQLETARLVRRTDFLTAFWTFFPVLSVFYGLPYVCIVALGSREILRSTIVLCRHADCNLPDGQKIYKRFGDGLKS